MDTGIQPSLLRTLIHDHEVHVWYVLTDELTDERLLARYDSLMSPSERERNRRYVFSSSRLEHLVTRALVRTTLSHYHPGVDPRDWQFTANAFGRPDVASPHCEPRLRFNLSHTSGLVACAVAGDREIGVDVENITRTRLAGVDIAERYFSPTEVSDIITLPASAQPDRFFDFWTLKESYIKARGLGLQLPLDQFSFHLQAHTPIQISFGPGIDDDPSRWQFHLQSLGPSHRLAIALARRNEADLSVRAWPVVPGEVPPGACGQAGC